MPKIQITLCSKMLLLIKALISNIVRTTRFCNNLHQVRSYSKNVESQIIQKSFGASKPKGLNRIAKVTKGPKQDSQSHQRA